MAAAEFDLSRRSLLRGNVSTRGWVARPPWAMPETVFIDTCERCDACITACPSDILRRGSGGYPELSFAEQGCDFCGDCLTACDGRALSADVIDSSTAFSHQIRIAAHCLANQGVGCQVCGDFCDNRAIRFHLRPGAPPKAELDDALCSGCGQCIAPCPVAAISVSMPIQEACHG